MFISERRSKNGVVKSYYFRFGLKLMVDLGNGGRVVNTSSLGGLNGITAKFGASHYGAAKAALINMTKEFG